jgi:negative regulator of sigma E activity
VTGAEFGEVDIDLLADYIGGALDGTPDESVVGALIADDPAWGAAYESLGGAMALVGAELGGLEPEPMPAELATRLAALFAAEPTAPALSLVRGGAAVADDAHAVPKTERERKSPARPGRRMRWAAPIAVAAGVIAFVGFGLDYLAGRDSSRSDSATSSAAGQADVKAAPLAPDAEQIYHSGRDYTLDELAGGPARSLVAPESSAQSFKKSSPGQAAVGELALQRLALRAALQDCLDAIERENAHGPLSVDSVDYARFAGTPAVIVHFTATNGAWGWASGAACGTPGADAATLGKVPVR